MHGEAKEWLDAFFFDSYFHVQSKWSHPWRPHAGLLTVLTSLCSIAARQ